MHVLLLTAWFPPLVSGAGSYLADVTEGLVAHGHRVTVVVSQGDPTDTEMFGARVITVHGRVRGSTSTIQAVRALALHRRDPVDLVLAGGAHPVGTVAAVVAR